MADSAALLDTNILIDYTRGIAGAGEELARYEDCAISIVTWMEVLAGEKPEREPIVREFLKRFRVIDINDEIAEQSVLVRRGSKRKLPDSIIFATAIVENLIFVTRNTRDFDESDQVRVPYRI